MMPTEMDRLPAVRIHVEAQVFRYTEFNYKAATRALKEEHHRKAGCLCDKVKLMPIDYCITAYYV